MSEQTNMLLFFSAALFAMLTLMTIGINIFSMDGVEFVDDTPNVEKNEVVVEQVQESPNITELIKEEMPIIKNAFKVIISVLFCGTVAYFIVKMFLSVNKTIKKLNRIHYCKECDLISREYQSDLNEGKCPHCSLTDSGNNCKTSRLTGQLASDYDKMNLFYARKLKITELYKYKMKKFDLRKDLEKQKKITEQMRLLNVRDNQLAIYSSRIEKDLEELESLKASYIEEQMK